MKKHLLLMIALLFPLVTWTQQASAATPAKAAITGTNLWHPTNPTITFWYADSYWSQVSDPTFTNNDGDYILYLHTSNSSEWQTQMHISNTGLSLSSSKQYAIRFEVTTDNLLPMTVKLQNPDDDNDYCYYNRSYIPAGTSVYQSPVFDGIDVSNAKLVFDFGGCQAGTTVSIKNITIGEAVDDGNNEIVTTSTTGLDNGDAFARNINGITWFFLITDKDKKTCQVGTGNTLYATGPAVSTTGHEHLTIPSKVDDYTVTAIGHRSFLDQYSLKSVTIPNTIEFIGDGAFAGTPLTSVVIPGSVKEIDEFAFGGCNQLTSVTLNEGLEIIGLGAFENLIGVKNWVLPASLKEIKGAAFLCWSPNEWESFTVKNTTPLTLLPDVFNSYSGGGIGNATLYVPAGTKAAYEKAPVWYEFGKIKETGNAADDGTHSHGFFTAASTDGINYSARITGDATCIIMSPNVLEQNKTPQTILSAIDPTTSGVLNVPSKLDGYTVVGLGEDAFFGCDQLTGIVLPNTIQTINSCSLGALGVKEISIPASVTSISSYAFNGARKDADGNYIEEACTLEKLTIDAQNPIYDSRDNSNAVIRTEDNTLICGINTTIIPESVTAIESHAFAGRTGLETIVVPESVKQLGYGVFSGCKNLTTVIIPDNIETIPGNTFFNCGFSTIKFPKNLKSIGLGAFQSCKNLVAVLLPEGLESMEEYAFAYCDNLRSITIPSTVLPNNIWTGMNGGEEQTWGGNVFMQCPNITTVISRIEEPYAINPRNFTTYNNEYDDDWNLISSEATFISATLYVPTGTRSSYLSTYGWNKFDNIVEGDPVEITPLEETVETTFSDFIDETTDLTSTVIDNVYYTVDAASGDGYDTEEQCIILNNGMTESEVDAIMGEEVGSDELRDGFNGIVFEVPAGSGTITVTAQTLGTTTLNVKIGSNAPQTFSFSDKATATVPYSVAAPTYVYIYAGAPATSAKFRAPVAGANSLKIYSMTWLQETTDIDAVETVAKQQPTVVYTLSGQRIQNLGGNLPKGIYIINGKKTVVK